MSFCMLKDILARLEYSDLRINMTGVDFLSSGFSKTGV